MKAELLTTQSCYKSCPFMLCPLCLSASLDQPLRQSSPQSSLHREQLLAAPASDAGDVRFDWNG
eukprot:scaffold485514_cov49-Prasinocladus_malaysianus.AAC.2